MTPISAWRNPAPRFSERTGRHLYNLDWQNRRLARLTTIPQANQDRFDETAAVELRNGGILAQWRTNAEIMQSTATPDGLAW